MDSGAAVSATYPIRPAATAMAEIGCCAVVDRTKLPDRNRQFNGLKNEESLENKNPAGVAHQRGWMRQGHVSQRKDAA
jgi:hypothetical protein